MAFNNFLTLFALNCYFFLLFFFLHLFLMTWEKEKGVKTMAAVDDAATFQSPSAELCWFTRSWGSHASILKFPLKLLRAIVIEMVCGYLFFYLLSHRVKKSTLLTKNKMQYHTLTHISLCASKVWTDSTKLQIHLIIQVK